MHELSDTPDRHPRELRRVVTLTMLVLYGLGVTVGAGIYVLVGAAAARAGAHTPIAFGLAAVVMAFSAASFAELSSRFPVSAGEAAFVRAAFGSRLLGLVTGLLAVAAAIVCAATISRGAAGYIGVFVTAHPSVLAGAVVLVMGAIAAYGIGEAVTLAGIMTLIEIAGLVMIVAAGFWVKPDMLARAPEMWTGLGAPGAWSGILGAAVLAFFAFIGFEGMVNIAEEVESPRTTIPRAILLTLVISTVLYILVVWVAIHTVPRTDLARSQAPLALVYTRLTGMSPAVLSAIAIFATINGIIANMIMASRVLYGLAGQGSLPGPLARVSPRTQTPLVATALVVAIVLALAVAVPIERLAETTTYVMLVVFTLVNAALVKLKLAEAAGRRLSQEGSTRPTSAETPTGASFPVLMPIAGTASCIALLVAALWV
jgi:amino acid transporter